MGLNFQEYVAAVKGLAENAYAAATMSKEASVVLKRYSHYLDGKTKEGTGDALSFEKWSAVAGNINAIPLLADKDENAKKDAIKTAQDYLNNNVPVNKAQEELFENGKYVIKKAGNLFEMLSDFLKQNPITLAALGLGAVAGNALGFGIIGTVLIAGAAAVAGGALGDHKNGGFVGKLLGLKPHSKEGKAKEGSSQESTVAKSETISVDINDPILDLTGKDGKQVSVEVKDGSQLIMKIEGKVQRNGKDVSLLINKSQKADHCGALNSSFPLTEPAVIALLENGKTDPKTLVTKVEEANKKESESLVSKNKDIALDNNTAFNPTNQKSQGAGLIPR